MPDTTPQPPPAPDAPCDLAPGLCLAPPLGGGGLPPLACTAGSIRRAMRQLGQLYDDALAPCGLKATQVHLLHVIGLADGASLSELARDLVMDLSALGHTLKPLQRDGLVGVAPDARDRRVRRITLTAQGRARLDQATPLWHAAHGAIEDMLGAHRSADLRATMDWLASPRFAQAFRQGTAKPDGG